MNKGFTLIELLAVIIVLSIILAVAVPLVLKTLNDSKEDSYEITVNNIEKITSYYVTENIGLFSNQDSFNVSLETLCSEKYLECPVYNPSNEQEISGYTRVTRTTGNKFTYEFVEE